MRLALEACGSEVETVVLSKAESKIVVWMCPSVEDWRLMENLPPRMVQLRNAKTSP
ncbi:MAG: hypothetical protein KBH45_06860 [Verrucomicrobia bacterium]|nr:hypothetical protein [Verrucomicrobiota bacterium]